MPSLCRRPEDPRMLKLFSVPAGLDSPISSDELAAGKEVGLGVGLYAKRPQMAKGIMSGL